MRSLCVIFWSFWMGASYGQVLRTVQIREVSSSQRSIIIDRGERQGIEPGMRALFIKAVSPTTFHKELVGLARVVKVFREQSVWYFTKTAHPEHLVGGESVGLFTDRATLQGLLPPQISRHLRVSWPDPSRKRDFTGVSGHTSARDPSIVQRERDYNEVEIPLRSAGEETRHYRRNIFDLAEWTEVSEGWGVFLARTLRLAPPVETVRRGMEEERQLALGWFLVKRSRWHGEHRERSEYREDQDRSQWADLADSPKEDLAPKSETGLGSAPLEPEEAAWTNWSNPFDE